MGAFSRWADGGQREPAGAAGDLDMVPRTALVMRDAIREEEIPKD